MAYKIALVVLLLVMTIVGYMFFTSTTPKAIYSRLNGRLPPHEVKEGFDPSHGGFDIVYPRQFPDFKTLSARGGQFRVLAGVRFDGVLCPDVAVVDSAPVFKDVGTSVGEQSFFLPTTVSKRLMDFDSSETGSTDARAAAFGDHKFSLPSAVFSSRKFGANNCLFDAVIRSAVITDSRGRLANSQALREVCDSFLESEKMPTIPKNHPAGEQYLQALSFLTKSTILVSCRGSSGIENRHESVAEDAPVIRIQHVGSQMHGHWESAR